MSQYKEAIRGLVKEMKNCGFVISNPSDEKLGVSRKVSKRFTADVVYQGVPLKLTADYTNIIGAPDITDQIFGWNGNGYESCLDPNLGWVGLSRKLPLGDYTILPDNIELPDFARFSLPRGSKFIKKLDEFGQDKKINWDEATVFQNGYFGHEMRLEYNFLRKPDRKCNFGLDITPKTKEVVAKGGLPNHELQPKENHFCILADEYPLFPYSLKQAGVTGIRFDYPSKLGDQRFSELFGGMPLPLNFQVSLGRISILGGSDQLVVNYLARKGSSKPTAETLRDSMETLEKFYQGFRSLRKSNT